MDGCIWPPPRQSIRDVFLRDWDPVQMIPRGGVRSPPMPCDWRDPAGLLDQRLHPCSIRGRPDRLLMDLGHC